MTNPDYNGEPATMFYCSNDAAAKSVAGVLAIDLGFDPVDAGGAPLETRTCGFQPRSFAGARDAAESRMSRLLVRGPATAVKPFQIAAAG